MRSISIFFIRKCTRTGSIDTAFTTGSEGGVIPSTVSTAYTASFSSKSGIIQNIIDNNSPQFNGELGGTVLTVTTQSLNPGNPYLSYNQPELNYSASIYTNFNAFKTGTLAQGEIKLYYYTDPFADVRFIEDGQEDAGSTE